MPDSTRDPVHRARYAFAPDGENLVVDCWIEPGGGLPEHLHPRQEERWSVVDGRIKLKLDGVERTIGPEDGEQVVAPGTRHALASAGHGEAHLRCHVLPAGDLEAFLTESAAAARDGLFMRGGIPRSLRGARWAASFLERHRAEVVMTFPPQFVQSALIALLARGGGTVAGL
jgi:quercetin dioxygenase-like cupin family protein